MKRIFLAIPLADDLAREILEWEKQHLDLPVRRMPPENLHVTLVPPWYAEEAPLAAMLLKEGQSIPDTVSRLKSLQGKIEPFDIKFEKVGFGPNPREPRLIWASGEADKTINDLKLTINQALDRETEKRPFKLHVTLARFRPEDYKKFPIKELNERVSWQMRVDHIALYESSLSPGGADYEILDRIKLGKEEAAL